MCLNKNNENSGGCFGVYIRQIFKKGLVFFGKRIGVRWIPMVINNVLYHWWILVLDGMPPMNMNMTLYSSHHASETLAHFAERGVIILEWPPCSRDLNPTEKVSCWMKDYI